MTPVEIAAKAAEWLLPFLKKNKLIEEIAGDFKEAAQTELRLLWQKVKPIFIEDFNDGEGRLDEAAESQPAVKKVLEKTVKNDETLGNALSELLATLDEKAARGEISISGSTNVVVGVQNINVGGDFIVGGTKNGS
ncbi:MAG: hypothetical protein IT259_14390 [Saprospiraceae bacterium]|nr:hypothetical protein [Saprospiraceae bacterium]